MYSKFSCVVCVYIYILYNREIYIYFEDVYFEEPYESLPKSTMLSKGPITVYQLALQNRASQVNESPLGVQNRLPECVDLNSSRSHRQWHFFVQKMCMKLVLTLFPKLDIQAGRSRVTDAYVPHALMQRVAKETYLLIYKCII